MISFLFFIFHLLPTFPVSAHTLETDGVIGAVLHVDPDDDPYVGQSSGFFFEIKDRSAHFQSSKCLCTLSLNKDGKVISTEEIQGEDTTLNGSILFPEKGAYEVVLNGKPRKEGDFQPFTLHFNFRASRVSGEDTSRSYILSHLPHIGLGALALIICFFSFRYRKKLE